MIGWIERLAMKFLRGRGWIVFWLDEPARKCSHAKDGCWLKLYLEEVGREQSV